MDDVYIIAAKRTPQGRFMGGLAKHSAVDLGVAAGRATLDGIDPDVIDQVIVGNVLAAGQGMSVARQIGVTLDVPLDRPAFTVNMMCGSGMQAVALADQAIRLGSARAVLCGGIESMSNAPYLLDRARGGYKLGDGILIDSVLRDGLVDSFDGRHMGVHTDRLASEYGIDRAAQDEFAWASQQRTAAAQAANVFADEIVAVGDVTTDEHPRPDTTIEKLATLSPAFGADGTVTAGNASGINDGAAMLVVCDPDTASQLGRAPLAKITGHTAVGCEPQRFGIGPVLATRTLCSETGVAPDALDVIEMNEAFAAQVLACVRELGINRERLNPHGGAIALGHPIGASGARLVAHLAHQTGRGLARRSAATACVGGGMGAAMMLEVV
ncbi:MAG: acetyl-CoA C-acyltransferase [Planctomycetaceae bacterium]|nr:acetyl-CoA C-acyltransferase [Planctomycetaceae bacterium]